LDHCSERNGQDIADRNLVTYARYSRPAATNMTAINELMRLTSRFDEAQIAKQPVDSQS